MRLMLVMTVMVAATTASAQQGRGQGGGRSHGDQEHRESLSDSVRRVERDRGGQVLGAERVQSDGRDVNRVKWVDGRGRVRLYMDDPRDRGQHPRGGDRRRGRERDGDD